MSEINVLNPEGELVSIPKAQLNDALTNGYQQATPEDISSYVRNQKYGGTGEQVKTALEGAASAATFGLSTGVEKAFGAKDEDIQGRREENPGAHMLGQLGGLAATALIPGVGEANAAKTAGVAGAEALEVASAAAKAAKTINPLSAQSIMTGAGDAAARALGIGSETAAQKIASSGVRGAAEMMLLQSGDEVSKMLSSDPDQSFQTAVTNIGLSGLLGSAQGAGIQAASSGIQSLWNATAGKKLSQILGGVKNEAENAAQIKGELNIKMPEKSAASPEQEALVQEHAGLLKPNADEISQAASRLNIRPTIGTLSDSHFIQNLEDGLIKRPTHYGQKLAEETKDAFHKMTGAAESTLKGASTDSEATIGKKIKGSLHETLKKELEPIEASYEELKPHFKNMEVPENLRNQAIENIGNHELVTIAEGTEAANLASKLQKEISNLKTVDQVKTYRTLINERLNKAYRAGGEELPILSAAKKELTALREASIEAASRKTGIGKEAGQISSSIIDDIREADKKYRSYKDKLKALGTEASLGNPGSARQLLERFSKLPDEALATRIFDVNDINQLNFFKKEFPKAFEMARSYKLRDIYEKSINESMGKNGKFDIAKYLNQLSDTKINPEAREVLLGKEGIHKYQDIRTMYRAMPGNANPSGTAAAIAMGHLFSVQGLADNVSDAVKYAVLKGLPHLQSTVGGADARATAIATLQYLKSDQSIDAQGFKAAVDYIKNIIQGENLTSKAVKAIFKSGSEVLPNSALPKEKDTEKLDKFLQEQKVNPQKMMGVGGKSAYYFPDHGEAIGKTASNAFEYLNTLKPNEDPKFPLDQKFKASDMEKEIYQRALNIAEQPLVVLKNIKEGTLTPEDVTHLKALYPSLYLKLAQGFVGEITNQVHNEDPIPYSTRLNLSLFLGQPLDSTMTPEAILATQSKPQQQVPQEMKPKHSFASLNKMPGMGMTATQAREAKRVDV